LPISDTITNTAKQRAAYYGALEVLSAPLMARYRENYSFGTEYLCEDGVRSNFYFNAYDDAAPAWRYPDLTSQAEFLGEIVRSTIEVEMRQEALFLRNMERARESVKNHLEGPNADIDQIIRSVSQNGWTVSNKLVKAFPALADPALASAVLMAVREVFEPADEEGDANDDYESARQPGKPRLR
jgi:hypothetical protein